MKARVGWLMCALASAALFPSFTLTACNGRFAFDVATAGGGSGGAPSQAGSAAIAGGGAGALGGGAGVAGGCGTRQQCPAGLHCADGHCYPCAVNADCTEPGLGQCDPTRHRCVACLTTADCSDGFSCDPLANRCLRACQTKSDCPADAHGCDQRRNVCYQCDEDRECAKSALGPLCASDGSGCVRCRTDADCSDQHCDQLLGRCVECRDWQDCDSSLCDPASATCAEQDD